MWWHEAVVYQVYPRSFADGDGDGVGDLHGLRQRLDHLAWLGVDAVWLSPIYRSPMADFGYDVSDHCDIDPLFGTLTDFDRFLADAHARGIRVVLDWVPNHTSIEHRWWDEHPDWYVWRDGDPAVPPNNWIRAFPFPPALPAWTWDERRRQWYLHLFLPEQPDVDWSNPELEAAMHGVLRFWLDRGVDGFRADVAHCLGKDAALPDDPPEAATIPHSSTHEHPLTFGHLEGVRRVLDEYDERMMVGEIYLTGERITERTAAYAGPDRLHLAFDFSPLFSRWGDAGRWRRRIERIDAAFADADGRWPTWVLSNHDNPRHRTRYGGSEASARAAAVLLLGLRGTPFLYAGEELGLEDAFVPDDRRVDPGGRDGCRAPLPWSSDPAHGWGPDPWLPFPPEASARSAEAQRGDPTSVLWLYKRLLDARRSSPALRRGDLQLLDGDESVAWLRTHGDDRRGVVVDVGGDGIAVPEALRGWTVEVASDGPGGEGEPVGDELAPGRAVVLRPG